MASSLKSFKLRYSNLQKYFRASDIGFEDYFLLHYLLCGKYKVVNPDRYTIMQCLRMFFIDSIYNFGKIQTLYKLYPNMFVDFLNSFDSIYTTNYDFNLEKATEKRVEYLHGAFHIVDDAYNPHSLRNSLSDNPFKSNKLQIPDEFMYLHSTALMTYSGDNKEFYIDTMINANSGLEKLATGYLEKPELQETVNAWKNDPIMSKLYEALQLKLSNPSLQFQESTSLNTFKSIEGELDIIGLSPFNDNHIFEAISKNKNLATINYYYYDPHEIDSVKSILEGKSTNYRSIVTFWQDIVK